LWLIDPDVTREGAPAKNQIAISVSKIMQPNDDVGMNGQIGLPQRWCAMSQPAWISHATPMNRYDRRPANAIGIEIAA
jgi:hypothetical protein